MSVNDIANGATKDVSLFLSYLSLSPLDSSVELCLKSEGITAVLAGPSGPSILQHFVLIPNSDSTSQVAYESGDRPQDDLHLRGAKTCQDSTKTTQNQA